MPISDQDRQAFQDVIKMPGFFTMGPGVQRNALRSVGVFSKADDGVLDQVLSRVKSAMPADFQGSPLGFTQPPPRLGITPQPVGSTEGIREEAAQSILGPRPGPNPEFTYEARNGDLTMVPRKQPGTGNKWTDFERGLSQGMSQVGVDLTSPTNIALMAGSFLKFPKLATKFPRMFKAVQGAVKTGFGVQMFEGILDEIPEAKKAFDRGDYQGAGAAVSKALVDIGFLGGLTKEPIERGVGKVRQKVSALRNPPAAPTASTTAPPALPIEPITKPTAPPPAPAKPAPRQPGLFEPPETSTPAPQAVPPTAAPPSPSAPVQAQGALASKAKELFGESLGQEYADAVQSGNSDVVKQFEVALAPEQLKELEPLKPKAEAKPTPAPAPPVAETIPPAAATEPKPESTPAPPTSESRRGEIWTPAEPVPPVGEIVPMRPKDIVADPKRFQFKREAVGKSGTTDKLEDVQKFDPRKAGVIAVWKDPVDGKVYVSNGHHRLELAKRADADKINVQFLDAANAQQAMAQGAIINIVEGQGTATDAAKLFRDAKFTPEDLQREGLSIKGKLVKQGLALAKLDPSIFQTVVDGTITTGQGALIGEKMPDSPVQQKKVAEYLARKQQGGETVKPGKLSEFIDFVRGAETKTDTVEDLFGEQQIQTSLADEKATISEYIRDALSKEKRLFGTVGKSGVSETLKRGGNVISESENQKISEQAAQALSVYDKLKLSAGPVSQILDDAARELAEGGKSGEIKARAYERVREAVAQLLGGKPESAGGLPGGSAKPPQNGGKGTAEGNRGSAAGELPLTAPPPGF